MRGFKCLRPNRADTARPSRRAASERMRPVSDTEHPAQRAMYPRRPRRGTSERGPNGDSPFNGGRNGDSPLHTPLIRSVRFHVGTFRHEIPRPPNTEMRGNGLRDENSLRKNHIHVKDANQAKNSHLSGISQTNTMEIEPVHAEGDTSDEAARQPTSKPHSVSPRLRALRVCRPEGGRNRAVRPAPRAARVQRAPSHRHVPVSPGRPRRRRRRAGRRRRAFPSQRQGGRAHASAPGRTAPS